MKSKPKKAHGLAAAALSFALFGSAQAAGLEYIGQQIVPTGTQFAGTTVGGLSGVDFDAASGAYTVISDDRSSFNPARYYTVSLDLAQFQKSAAPGYAGVAFNSVTNILDPAGAAFALNTVDPESIRHAANGKLYWSNEGQRISGTLQNPTVREMSADGSFVRDFVVPGHYNPIGAGPTDPGIRNNLAFESLTVSTDGKTLWTATENALVQDGLQSTASNGSPSRLLSFDIATGAAGAEYVYEVAPVVIPPNPANQFATNGLVELLALGDRQFIAVERSFAIGAVTPGTPVTGNTIRLFFVDARNATDVSGLTSLAGQSFTAASKTLLLDLSTLTNDDGSALALDNIEGITFGPQLNGKPTLVLVSDNNFSGTQFTQFVALSVTSPIPEPGTGAMMLAGAAALSLARRRQSTRH